MPTWPRVEQPGCRAGGKSFAKTEVAQFLAHATGQSDPDLEQVMATLVGFGIFAAFVAQRPCVTRLFALQEHLP
jgi:hypothetical protein